MTQSQSQKVLSLTEYTPVRLRPDFITTDLGEILWRKYSPQIMVDFPTPKTDGQWQFTSQGWVGFIPCTSEFGIALRPKVELGNLFRMLEYAYKLKSFHFLEGLVDCKSLQDFYERLANVLARRVLDRGRRGFYRTYLSETDDLPFIKGRVNIRQNIQKPWHINIHCRYEEHTGDIEENQILSWTLSRIAQSGMCTERVLPTVRRAYHALRGLASVIPFKPRDCIGRLYNRLNDDYQPLHALCRFFLEHSGPSHEYGDKTMLPFLVNMERLYELFVAEWLRAHLPPTVMLKVQEKVDVGEGQRLSFKIDLVLYGTETGEALCVLDTKYKAKEEPDTNDVAKVVAYAEMKRCAEAILVYPVSTTKTLDALFGKIKVKNMSFSLAGDLEEAGQAFLSKLLDITKGMKKGGQAYL
ncbi:MAG: restriction endonuclease [Desulfobacteraceae bacterium]|nr:restriction endonuclease [Desulfobacteraceae bacterium]